MDQTATSTIISQSSQSARAFERAKNAVFVLRETCASLSSQEEETLGILMDKELMSQLNASLREAKIGNTEPLENILD